MSIIRDIPIKALPIETNNRFAAVFNAQGLGQYNFTLNTANIKNTVMNLDARYVYFIERLSFSASIDEAQYLINVDDGNEPQFRLFYSQTKYALYPRSFPAINYKDNMEFNYFFYNPKSNNNLQMTFQGILNQNAALVGIDTIYANVSLVIYQIEATNDVLEYIKKQPGRKL